MSSTKDKTLMREPNFQHWTAKIMPGQVTIIKTGAPDDCLHLKHACFGLEVQDDSRSVVFCQAQDHNSPICVLTQGRQENQSLNLIFPGGEDVSFTLKGQAESNVHLSGYIQPLIDVDDLGLTEQVDEPVVGQKRSISDAVETTEPPRKKLKEDEPAPEKMDEESNPPTANDDNDQEEQPAKEPTPPPLTKAELKLLKKRKKFTFDENHLGIRVVRPGSGEAAKKGDLARIRYITQVHGTSQILRKDLGEGMTIEIGKGDVIKGWDLGMVGIKANEKRKLWIPADLAFGKEGDEDSNVAPNSEILMTLECLEVLKAEA